jgi:hypothetical protein
MPVSITCSACSHAFDFQEGAREIICPNCGKALPVFLERTPTGPPPMLAKPDPLAGGPPEVEVSVITTPIPPRPQRGSGPEVAPLDEPGDGDGANGVLARIPLRKVSANDLPHDGSAPPPADGPPPLPPDVAPELMVSATLSENGPPGHQALSDSGMDLQPLVAPLDRPAPPDPPPVAVPQQNEEWVQGSRVIPPLNNDPLGLTPLPEGQSPAPAAVAPPAPSPPTPAPASPEQGIMVSVPMVPVEEVQLKGKGKARPKRVRIRRTSGQMKVLQPRSTAAGGPKLLATNVQALDADLIPQRNLKPLLIAGVVGVLALAGILIFLLAR